MYSMQTLPQEIKKVIIAYTASAPTLRQAASTVQQLKQVNSEFYQLMQQQDLKRTLAYTLIRCTSSLTDKRTIAQQLAISEEQEYKDRMLATTTLVSMCSTIPRTITKQQVSNGLKYIKKLLTLPIDYNAYDDAGNTALIYAVRANNSALVAVLLKHGADTNIQNKQGMTTLMYAAYEHADTNILQKLLKAGAHTFLKDNNHFTALDWAHARNCYPLILHQERLLDAAPVLAKSSACNIM